MWCEQEAELGLSCFPRKMLGPRPGHNREYSARGGGNLVISILGYTANSEIGAGTGLWNLGPEKKLEFVFGERLM